MYDKYCDTYYLTQGAGRQIASITMLNSPNVIPSFHLKRYEVVRKNNEDFVIDECGGYVKIEDLNKYQITFN